MPFMKIDRLDDVFKSIESLVQKQVMVGVPDGGKGRDNGQPISNAEIGYLMENGSPANNVPARPHLVPGVADAEPKIAPQLQKGVEAALDGDLAAVDRRLTAAGMVAVSAVKARIRSGIGPELKPSTIANRYRQRQTKSARAGEKKYAALLETGAQAAGMSLAEIQSAAGIIPLVNTGQYRNSITFVLRKKR